jgi:enoyl reductase-like protein
MERQELDERASGITGELLKDVVFLASTDPQWHCLQENKKTAIARLHRELDKVYFPEVDDVL